MVEATSLDLVDDHPVGAPDRLQSLFGHLPDDPDRQPRPWEGLALDHVVRHLQRPAHPAHLVLEEVAKRLHQRKAHALGQPPDVVVGLDLVGPEGVGRGALDHVRIERSLGQEGHPPQTPVLLFEGRDEFPTYDPPLFLWVDHPLEGVKEARFGLHPHDLHPHAPAQGLNDPVAFAAAEQPVVDEYTGELVADRPVDQGGRHRRVDPARQGADDLLRADLLTDLLHRLVYEALRRPATAAPTGSVEEVAEKLQALGSVSHLGMELDADPTSRPGHRRDRAVHGVGHRTEAMG